jgi:hypothetical protein
MSTAHSAEPTRTHLATVPTAGQRPPCEGCGAPLDLEQRYCVHCGARRPDVEEPALSWMAARKARLAGAQPAAAAAAPPTRNPLALPALALLLLPVVAAIGVAVGRGGSDSPDPQLLQALRNQKAPIVKVGDVAAGGTTTRVAKAKAAKHAKTGKRDASGGKVVAKTKYGVAHQISGFKPTQAKVNSDRKLVQNINKSIGKNYLQAQRNLPDTIVVPTGTQGGSSPSAQGRGD